MKQDFWWMLALYLLFILFAAGAFYWGSYIEIALAWLAAGVLGALVIFYIFRPDSMRRGRRG